MHISARQSHSSDQDRTLAIGLGAGLGGLFILSLLGVTVWACLRRNKAREPMIELENASRAASPAVTQNRPTTLTRLSSFLRSSPNDAGIDLEAEQTKRPTAWYNPTRPRSAKLSKAAHIVPITQFEVEIGSHDIAGRLRLKRLRPKDDTSSSNGKRCRRKLSKRNATAIERPDQMPIRLLVEEEDLEARKDDGTHSLILGADGHDEPTQQEKVAMFPVHFTQIATRKTHSATGALPRSFSATIMQVHPVDRPILHSRSLTYSGTAVGPAPIGPLPPLPTLTAPPQSKIECRNSLHHVSPVKSITAEGEKLQSPRPVSKAISTCSNLSKWCIGSHTTATQLDAPVAHSQSASVNTWRSSVSPLTSEKRVSDSPLFQGWTAGSRSSRMSTHGTLAASISKPSSASPMARSITPRQLSTRVSFDGSPAQRRRGMVLQSIAGNAIKLEMSRTPSDLSQRDSPSKHASRSPNRQRSALKSPGSPRKGHQRKGCVRISTLKPTIHGASASENSLLDDISEDSPNYNPDRALGTNGRDHDRSPRLLHSRRSHLDPVKWRASLTPSSPTLSMSRFRQDFCSSTGASADRRSAADLQQARSADLLSIPSLASFGSHIGIIEDRTPTPTIELTRPSGEHDRGRDGFPFEFDFGNPPVQPHDLEDSTMSWSPPPLDDDWDEKIHALPATVGADWRYSSTLPENNVTIVASASSSSLEFPFADGCGDAMCSDPLDAHSGMRSTNRAFDRHNLCTPPRPRSLSDHHQTRGAVTPATSLCSSPPANALERQSFTKASAYKDARPLSVQDSVGSSPSILFPDPAAVSASRPISSHSRALFGSPGTRLRGPRNHPPNDLRRSILQLRRMNSDLQGSSPRARRYLKLGREASPVLPFAAASFGGFPVFDDGDAESLLSDQGAEMGEGVDQPGPDDVEYERWLGEGDKGNREHDHRHQDHHQNESQSQSQSQSQSRGHARGAKATAAGGSFDFRFEFPCPSAMSRAAVEIMRQLESETVQAAEPFGAVEGGGARTSSILSGADEGKRGRNGGGTDGGVWDVGHLYWSPGRDLGAPHTPVAVAALERQKGRAADATPRSLYDAAGFYVG